MRTFASTVKRYSCVSFFLFVASFGLTAQPAVTDTLRVSLSTTTCNAKRVNDVECEILGRMLLSELEAFYTPSLQLDERQQRMILFIEEGELTGTPGDTMTIKRIEVEIKFALTDESIEVRAVENQNGGFEANVNERRKYKDPRKDIARVARAVIREIIRKRTGTSFGREITWRVRVPRKSSINIPGSDDGVGRWQLASLPDVKNLSYLYVERDSQNLKVNLPEVVPRNTFTDWKLHAPTDGRKVSLRPVRFLMEFSGSLGITEGDLVASSGFRLITVLHPRFTARTGMSYLVTPLKTQLEPIPGITAEADERRAGSFVPVLGVGYNGRSEQLALRYGINLDGFPAPVLARAQVWVALDSVPWIRLNGALQYFRPRTDTPQFSRNTPTALLQPSEESYFTPQLGISFLRTL